MDILFLVGRILFGGFFLMMGMNHFMKMKMMTNMSASKGVPLPGMLVPLTGMLIMLGGLGIILGIYIEISVLFIGAFLFFTSFKMHTFWKEENPDNKMIEMVNFMKNMALLGAALMMLFISSPWKYSLF